MPLEAVEALWPDGDVIDPLSVLVDHSLVRRTTGNRDEPRFGMLALVREHAARLLDDSRREPVAAAHAAYVAAFVEDLFERRWTDAADRWLDDITEMLAEVRAAHDWAWRRGDLPLTAASRRPWAPTGTSRGTTPRASAGSTRCSPRARPRPRGRRPDPAGGRVPGVPPEPARGARHWQRAAELFRELGETRLLAYALAVTSATYLGEPERYALAMRVNDEALALGRSVGGPALIAQVLNVRGELTRVAGRGRLAAGGVRGGSADLPDSATRSTSACSSPTSASSPTTAATTRRRAG